MNYAAPARRRRIWPSVLHVAAWTVMAAAAASPAAIAAPALAEASFQDAALRVAQVPSKSPTNPAQTREAVPRACRVIPLGGFLPGQSPVPQFWSTLTATLVARGLSKIQTYALQEVFGHLDAPAVQNLSVAELLPAMRGRTVAERMQRISLFQTAVQDVHSCLTALSRNKA